MPIFKIPVIWQMFQMLSIEADNLKDAIDNAYDADLPTDGSYIEGSFEVDVGFADELAGNKGGRKRFWVKIR
jgi:hypothetical protein